MAPEIVGCGLQEECEGGTDWGSRKIERGASEREERGYLWSGRDRKGVGVIRKLLITGGNTRRGWGNVWQITNSIRMHIPLTKSGGGRA